MISSRRKERVWEDDEDTEDGYGTGGAAASIDLGRKGPHSRVGSVSIDGIPVIREDPTSSNMSLAATPRPGPARPMAVRVIPNGSAAVLEVSFPGTPVSRAGSYSSPSPRTPSRIASESQTPLMEGAMSRRPSRSSMVVGNRHSIPTLMPGPIAAGYQLKVAVGDLVGGRTAGVLEEPGAYGVHETGGRDGGQRRRRSGSLGVVLDLLKQRGKKGPGEMDNGEDE